MARDEDGGKFPRLVIAPPPTPERFVERGGQTRYDPSGPSMLDIVAGAAQAVWAKAVKEDGQVDVDLATRAAMLAAQALPYTNPKLAAVVVKNVGDAEAAEAKALKVDADAVRRKLERMIGQQVTA